MYTQRANIEPGAQGQAASLQAAWAALSDTRTNVMFKTTENPPTKDENFAEHHKIFIHLPSPAQISMVCGGSPIDEGSPIDAWFTLENSM